MSKRFWLTASILGLLVGLPAALVVYNLGVFSPHSQGAADITLGMILLGVAMVGLGAIVGRPAPVTAVVREIRRQSASPRSLRT